MNKTEYIKKLVSFIQETDPYDFENNFEEGIKQEGIESLYSNILNDSTTFKEFMFKIEELLNELDKNDELYHTGKELLTEGENFEKKINGWKEIEGNGFKRYVKGDYAICPVQNEFNEKISYWMTKTNMTVASYCFSATNEADITSQFSSFEDYKKIFQEKFEKEKKVEINMEHEFSKLSYQDKFNLVLYTEFPEVYEQEGFKEKAYEIFSNDDKETGFFSGELRGKFVKAFEEMGLYEDVYGYRDWIGFETDEELE